MKKRLNLFVDEDIYNKIVELRDELCLDSDVDAARVAIKRGLGEKQVITIAGVPLKKIGSSDEDNYERPEWIPPSKRVSNKTVENGNEVRVEDLPYDITREEKIRRSQENMAKYKPNLTLTAAQMVAELNGTEVDEEADFEEKKQALRKKFPHLSEAKIEEMASVEFDADGNPIY